jgi:hypothetical protein
MYPRRESLPAVTAAGVVATLFAAAAIFFGLLVQIALFAMPNMTEGTGAAQMPATTRAIGGAFWFFVMIVGVGELIVAINVFRRRNWARIVMLIWGGVMAFFSALSCVAVIFVFSVMPPQTLPNVKDPAQFLAFMKFFMVLFYGIPFAVAVWWLILFTRPGVAAAFRGESTGQQAYVPIDASGFPAPALAANPSFPKKPSCPVPLIVVAGLLLCSAISTPLILLLPTAPSVPMFFFGFMTSPATGKLIVVALSIAYGVLAVSLLRLNRLAIDAILLLQVIFFVNGIATVVSPSFIRAMREAMHTVDVANGAQGVGFLVSSDGFIRGMMIFGLIFSLAMIGVLVGFRGRFLEAAAKAEAA